MLKINENRIGYKKTSLGWIPEEWDVKNFSDCCESDGKYGINAPAVEFQKELPTYLRITDIDENGKFIESDKKSVDRDNYKEYILNEGDIVFARTGATVGKTYLYNKNDGILVYAGFLIKFHPIPDIIIPYFVKTFTDSLLYWKWVKKICMRSGQPGINSTEYGTLLLPVPSIEEQRFISNIFHKYDRKIELINKLIKLKEKHKKALMQQLLTGRKRLKGFTDKWKNKNFGDLLLPTLRPVNKPDDSYLSLGIRSHGKGTFLKNDFDPEDIDIETLYEVKENDLIVNITFAWEGAIAIAKKEDNGALVSHRFPTYTFNNTNGIVDYFRYVIIQPRFKYLLETISPGGAGRNRVLSKRDFLKLEVNIPSVEEQKAISEILITTDREIELIKQKLELLKKQKRGLMQVLLTGKVRVKI